MDRACIVSTAYAPATNDGGLAVTMRALAELLARECEVTVITDAEVRDAAAFRGPAHAYAAAVLEAFAAAYPDGGCDLVVAADRLAETACLLQARRAGHPALRGTTVVLHLAGASELRDLHNGTIGVTPGQRLGHDLERWVLREADQLWAPCAEVARLYADFFGADELAPMRVLPTPGLELSPAPLRPAGDAVRLLYLGRLERCDGALDVVDGFRRVAGEDWRLTLAGADTETAVLGTSVSAAIDVLADPRIDVREPVSREALPALYAEHDVLVVPARVATWSPSACEALRAGLPLLVTPVGGLPELAAGGEAGWICPEAGPEGLAAGLHAVLGDIARVRRLRGSPSLAAHAAGLTDPAPLLDALRELGATAPRVAMPAGLPDPAPLVSVVVPYFRDHAFIDATLAALAAQTYPNVEVIVVNGGSYETADAGLWEIAARHGARVLSFLNRSVAASRNAGVRHADGRYVAFMDGDNVAHPEWLAQSVAMLLAEPELGYVTNWMRYVDVAGEPVGARWCPFGNELAANAEDNAAGGAAAVVPRERFVAEGLWFAEEQMGREDLGLWRAMWAAGRRGRVIPAALHDLRTHPAQLSHVFDGLGGEHARLACREIDAALRRGTVRWTTS